MNDDLCQKCRIRYWVAQLRDQRFTACEECRDRLRIAERAWKSWSDQATGGRTGA